MRIRMRRRLLNLVYPLTPISLRAFPLMRLIQFLVHILEVEFSYRTRQ
jgi:hypothetical protein